jgi:hypothetical protein
MQTVAWWAIAHQATESHKPHINRDVGRKSGHLYELLRKLLSSGREK